MGIASGVVEGVANSPKVFSTKYGEKCHRSFKLSDGNWYTLQFDNPEVPGVSRGESVTFMFKEEVNGKYTNRNVDKKSLEKENNAGAPSGGASSSVSGSSRSNSGSNNTQLAIQHQASRNSAISVVTCAVNNGLVKLPTKQADKYDALVALVDNLTARYNADTSKVTESGILPTSETSGEGEDAQEDMGEDDALF